MKRSVRTKIISALLIMALVVSWLPLGVASAASGGGVAPTPAPLNGYGRGEYVSNEVLAPADSMEHAQAIAQAYGLQLKSYASGIAVLATSNPEKEVEQSGESTVARRGNGFRIPELSFNRYYYIDEVTNLNNNPSYGAYQLPAQAYNPAAGVVIELTKDATAPVSEQVWTYQPTNTNELLKDTYQISTKTYEEYTETAQEALADELIKSFQPNSTDQLLKDSYQLPVVTYDQYLSEADIITAPVNAPEGFIEPLESFVTDLSNQWHHAEMYTERAWTVSTGKNVVIAVIDTGIDIDHTSFTGRISSKSYNAYSNSIGLEYVRDDFGHGTHVSGIAAGAYEELAGVGGIAPNAEIMAIKANRPYLGSFSSDDLYRAINYASENGADIINMSLSRSNRNGASYDALEQQVIANAVANGVTVICASGNNHDNHAGYPAAHPECIAVTATQKGFTFASYSNSGPEIDIAAPGSNIYSSQNNGGYFSQSGTSMAAPNVAGVAALVISLEPSITPQQLQNKLQETATAAGEPGRDDYFGYGIVNAHAAVGNYYKTFTILYDYNDGSHAPLEVKLPAGVTNYEPAEPIRAGFVFAAWYDHLTNLKHDFSKPLDRDYHLYAVWNNADSGTYAQEFPDKAFRGKVLNLLNWMDGGSRNDSSLVAYDLDLLASIEYLDLADIEAYDLKGLKYFTNLVTLICDNNRLTELDVSANAALKWLNCSYNQLSKLDVSNNIRLWYLDCSQNNLTELDVSRNTDLVHLLCDNNNLKEIDVSNNHALQTIYLFNNQLSDLDVSRNTALRDLNCGMNNLATLDVSNNNQLVSLVCQNNRLRTLDLSQNANMGYLHAGYNELVSLELFNCKNIYTLMCQGNRLSTLDLSNNSELIYLYADDNNLTELDLSNLTQLSYFYCYTNQISKLDVSKNYRLVELSCFENNISALDTSNNLELRWLNCFSNNLTGLDVTRNTQLEKLTCFDNCMNSTDDVAGWQTIPALLLGQTFWFYPQRESDKKDITASFKDPGFLAAVRDIIGKPDGPIYDTDVNNILELYLSSRSIGYTIYDLSGIEHFVSALHLDCSGQMLKELDLSQNTKLTMLMCNDNALDKLIVPPGDGLWFVNCCNNNLSSLDVSPSIGIMYLICFGNQLTELDVTNNIWLYMLACNRNNLRTLDVSNNTRLDTLECSKNQLITLDLSNNRELTSLVCTDNLLSELDVTGNYNLRMLNCSYNFINTIAVTNNTMLTYLNCVYNNMKSLNDVAGWQTIPTLILDQTFWFYPQRNSEQNDITDSFKDPGFLAAVRDLVGKPYGPIYDTDVNGVTELYIDSTSIIHTIYDLAGIENFVSLQVLSCYGQQLKQLDLSGNPELRKLNCFNCQLDYLNVSRNTALTDLECGHNLLGFLDISNNTELSTLYCYNNRLTVLDTSKNTALRDLTCFNNQITSLDVSNNTMLDTLSCGQNLLTELNVSNNVQLGLLNCVYNYMKSVDSVLGWRAIPGLVLNSTFLFDPQHNTGEVDITGSFRDPGFLAVVRGLIQKPDGPIYKSDVERITNLVLDYWTTGRTIYNLSGIEHFVNLQTLSCNNQPLQELDLSGNTALAVLDCSNNALTKLNVSQNSKLWYISCYNNNLASLDISGTTMLAYLLCYNNWLTDLDTSNNAMLRWISCYENQLTKLDVSNNYNLTMLECSLNYMRRTDDVQGWQDIGLVLNEGFRFHYQKYIHIVTQPAANTTVIHGAITEELGLTAMNYYEDKRTFYQWYSNKTASNKGGVPIAGATSETFSLPADLAPGTYYYYCVVSSYQNYIIERSNVATVNVLEGTVKPNREPYHVSIIEWYDLHDALNTDTIHTVESIEAARELLNTHPDVVAHGQAVKESYELWDGQRWLNEDKEYSQEVFNSWTEKFKAVITEAKSLLVEKNKQTDRIAYHGAVDGWHELNFALNNDTNHTKDSVEAALDLLNTHPDIAAHGQAVMASYEQWDGQKWLNEEKEFTQAEIDAWAARLNAVCDEVRALLVVKPVKEYREAYHAAVNGWFDLQDALSKDYDHTPASIEAAQNLLNNHPDVSAHGQAVMASYDSWNGEIWLNEEKEYGQAEIDSWTIKLNAVLEEAKSLLKKKIYYTGLPDKEEPVDEPVKDSQEPVDEEPADANEDSDNAQDETGNEPAPPVQAPVQAQNFIVN